jgi:hypothetical protein
VTSSTASMRYADIIALFGAAMLVARCALSGIVYDTALDAYRVTDFPAEYPCTPTLLAEMDRLLGLGKVTRDSQTGVCTVNCRLVIGANDGTSTYFQVGSPALPGETLVMRADLYVCPYYIPGENQYQEWWHAPQRVNRLALGDAHQPEIRPALKFDCTGPKHRFRLLTGVRPERDNADTSGRGGQLMAWNALITALAPSSDHSIDSLVLRGDGFVFVNSTLSWVKGMMLYGVSTGWRQTVQITDSTFEHGDAAVIGGKLELEGCTLRHCGTAVLDYGSVNVVMRNCTFANNRCNWHLRFPGKALPTLECVDCTIGPPQDANQMQRQETANTRALAKKVGTLQNPWFVSKRHLIVRVLNDQGEAIPKAKVTVQAEQPGADIDDGRCYLTDASGCTSSKPGPKALLLPEYQQAVTGAQSPPTTTPFSYTIRAAADGRTGTVTGVRPDSSWQTVTVTLN